MRSEQVIPEFVQENLRFFDKTKYEKIEEYGQCCFSEKSKDGKATLVCQLNKDAIAIKEPDKNVLTYLSTEKGVRSCPDGFLFVKEKEEKWTLYIIEFKKTLNTSTYDKSKWQFKMGIHNARAIGAFLGIEIQEIVLCSSYREETISELHKKVDLSTLRASNSLSAIKKQEEWRRGKCELEVDRVRRAYCYKKIKLNQNGVGNITL